MLQNSTATVRPQPPKSTDTPTRGTLHTPMPDEVLQAAPEEIHQASEEVSEDEMKIPCSQAGEAAFLQYREKLSRREKETDREVRQMKNELAAKESSCEC
ncbi:uncharacterized protein LOC108908830 isoform X2 [Anoplophora glabripennis]|uniref:uncharacterized protein LOC108908830 isoform X2 n=1 Tax=Anoplophora glabripennis TaxID=217634 RepID=UPI0008741548|nr:uncharacterized protein LOC108908830 isoform X2 [Anoplophora glabripennis]